MSTNISIFYIFNDSALSDYTIYIYSTFQGMVHMLESKQHKARDSEILH